jgi:hypothetical protein
VKHPPADSRILDDLGAGYWRPEYHSTPVLESGHHRQMIEKLFKDINCFSGFL